MATTELRQIITLDFAHGMQNSSRFIYKTLDTRVTRATRILFRIRPRCNLGVTTACQIQPAVFVSISKKSEG